MSHISILWKNIRQIPLYVPVNISIPKVIIFHMEMEQDFKLLIHLQFQSTQKRRLHLTKLRGFVLKS